ncbi:hypothetical protein DFH09DRAFT_1354613 [Mycena vulgaris]|nr:hypothetical protein DFH09DRAFT_1354613 [Mycena vulgaris]
MPSAKELIKARLLVAQADQAKKAARKASQKDKENSGRKGAKGAKGVKNAQDKKRKAPTVQWAKAEYHYLTDELLTIIEAKPLYKQSFGFDKGQAEAVATGGKRPIDLYTEVAAKLFHLEDDADDATDDVTPNNYTREDLPDLAKVVKNRISSLKSNYQQHHEKLGATGHGLVAGGKEDEIVGGTEIFNAWDKISKKFPWYKRMDRLMGTSPIVNRSALAHSRTRVDLGVLDRKGTAHNGPISVNGDSDDDTESKISGWSTSSPARRPGPRDDDDDDSNTVSSSPARPVTPTPKVKTEPRSAVASARGAKRKSMHDRIEEIASQDRSQRVKLTEVREKQKTVRAQAKYEAKTALEMAKMQHQQREGERQREHELMMMERQMQLEAMRRQQPPPALTYSVGAPAYGAPPPDEFLDPRFRG